MNALRSLAIFVLPFVFLACAQIQGVQSVNSLIGSPPVRALNSSDSSIIKVSGEIFSKANSPRRGRKQRDSAEVYNQCTFTYPKIAGALNADVFLSRDISGRSAISIGVAGGYIGKDFYKSFRFGYAFEKISEPFSVRFDIGIYSTDISSAGYMIWAESGGYNPYNPNNLSYSSEARGGRYVSFTLGLNRQESRWNPNLQASINWQGISGDPFESSTHDEKAAGMTFAAITPFLSCSLSETKRLVCGLRMIKEFEIKKTNGYFLLTPFVQYEMGL